MTSLSELPERIQAKIQPEPNTGCWIWIGSLDRKGYGTVFSGQKGKTSLAHRWVFAYANGPFLGSLDHACDQKSCVNPEHLRIMSSGDNTRRYYAKQTHCVNGHPLSGDNLYFEKRLRKCKACHAGFVSRWRAKRKSIVVEENDTQDREALEAELAAQYDLSLADFERIVDEYRDEGFSTRIKPFFRIH